MNRAAFSYCRRLDFVFPVHRAEEWNKIPISFSLTANEDILLLRKDSALFDKTVLNLLKREKCTARARIPAPEELGLHKTLEGVPSASQISQNNLGNHEPFRDFTMI